MKISHLFLLALVAGIAWFIYGPSPSHPGSKVLSPRVVEQIKALKGSIYTDQKELDELRGSEVTSSFINTRHMSSGTSTTTDVHIYATDTSYSNQDERTKKIAALNAEIGTWQAQVQALENQ